MTSRNAGLDRSLVHGLAWTGGIRWLGQLLSWAITIIVARLLTPADYGLAGMAAVYTGFTQLLCEAGLTAALLRQTDSDPVAQAQLGGFAGLLGIGCCLISVLLAAPVSWAFGEPAIREIIIVSSFGFIARGLQVLPRGLLARQLDFRTLAWIDGIEAVALSGVTLTLALMGAGVWSLVIGGLVGGVVGALLSFHWNPHRLTWPHDIRRIAEDVIFGGKVLGSQLSWYLYNNSDFAVVGRVLGSHALGAYTLAWTLANIPVDRVTSLVSRVTPAYFATLSEERDELRRYLLRLSEGLAFFTFPACVGLALIAEDLVRVVLGPGWAEAAVPLRALALIAAVRSVFALAAPILNFTGQVDRNLKFSVLLAVVLPLAFILVAPYGLIAVAVTWLVVYPALAVPFLMRHALRAVGLDWKGYLDALRVPVLATAVMSVALLVTSAALPAGIDDKLHLAIKVGVGALVYGGVGLVFARGRIRSVLALWRAKPAEVGEGPVSERVLVVVCYHFPPDPAIGGLRWEKLARIATERGWRVEVITRDQREVGRLDEGVARDLPVAVRVHRVSTPALRFAEIPSRLWLALRRRPAAGSRPDGARAPLRSTRPGSIGARDIQWWPPRARTLTRAYFAWLDHRRGMAWGRAAAVVARQCFPLGQRAILVSCGPPHPPHEALRAAAVGAGVPFILDLRDPWSLLQRLPESTASPLWLALARRDEARAVTDAALVVTTTEAHRTALAMRHRTTRVPIIAVRNGCDDPPVPRRADARRFVLAYAGTIYLDRDPAPLFEGVAALVREARLSPDELGIEFLGDVGSFDGIPLERLADRAGVGAFLHLYPPRSREEAVVFLSRASLLVLLPQDSHLAIPAKVYEYARYHAGILALAAPGSATAQLLEGTSADVVAPEDRDGIHRVLAQRWAAFKRGEIPEPLLSDPRFQRGPQAEILFDALDRVTAWPVNGAVEVAAGSPR